MIGGMKSLLNRHRIAFVTLVLLAVGSNVFALDTTNTGYFDLHDWGHVFCLTQAVLISAISIYGPASLIIRTPLVAAWAIGLACVLARGNLISRMGRVSIEAGVVLVITGVVSSGLVFAIHKWTTRASLSTRAAGSIDGSGAKVQVSLRTLMYFMVAFAVAGAAARVVATSPRDPYGAEHDILVIHGWLGFFACLSASAIVVGVFNFPKSIAFASGFCVLVAILDPVLLGLAGPLIFINKNLLGAATPWAFIQTAWTDTFVWHGEAAIATAAYAILARAAGLRMIYPDQSNDTKPKPSGEPTTDEACVQD